MRRYFALVFLLGFSSRLIYFLLLVILYLINVSLQSIFYEPFYESFFKKGNMNS